MEICESTTHGRRWLPRSPLLRTAAHVMARVPMKREIKTVTLIHTINMLPVAFESS
jgi:hypothetical protein